LLVVPGLSGCLIVGNLYHASAIEGCLATKACIVWGNASLVMCVQREGLLHPRLPDKSQGATLKYDAPHVVLEALGVGLVTAPLFAEFRV
jgi:hypothetical protein